MFLLRFHTAKLTPDSPGRSTNRHFSPYNLGDEIVSGGEPGQTRQIFADNVEFQIHKRAWFQQP